ncbi:MAG: histidine kinase [Lachnospiraceae bacterium]|nr:histidine kinase [Lachnospiraceae bacterium]
MDKKRMRIFALTLLLLLLPGCALQSTDLAEPTVKSGILELSTWDFSKQGNISLDGDWAFYWNELLSPGDFDDKAPTGYYRLPSGWTKYKELKLPPHGYATYRLAANTDSTKGLYGISIPNVYTDYALWVNGSLLHACGSFAQTQTVYLHPQIYDFYYAGSELEIVLQVKNNDLIYGGGVGQSIRLGTSTLIHKEHNIWTAVDLFLISICLFMGFFFLVLHHFKKGSTELVWLSALCFSVALRNMLSNTTLMMQAFPGLPFWLGSRLVMLTIPVIIISMLFYTRRLYKDMMPRAAFRIILSFNALYIFTVLAFPPTIYSAVFVPYLLTVGAACVLGCYVSVKAVKHHKKESAFFLGGMLILTLGALLDSLVYMNVFSARYMLSAALFGFIIIQVVLLSKRYSETFRRTELLSADLQASLDTIMNTETAYMSAQMKPHFLYNALSAIAECCETDPHKASNLIMSLSKYLRQTLDYDNLSGIVPLKKELELVRAYTSIEQARFENIEIVYDIPDPLPSIQIPPLTLQPLVENAIKHGLRKKREGGRVIVFVKQHDNGMVFTVEDNGVGIPDDAVKNLAVLPNGSVSIGLYNINMRLIRLYGQGLSIKSETGTGTSVSFQIPYREDD